VDAQIPQRGPSADARGSNAADAASQAVAWIGTLAIISAVTVPVGSSLRTIDPSMPPRH
jgi:hypothetical protein